MERREGNRKRKIEGGRVRVVGREREGGRKREGWCLFSHLFIYTPIQTSCVTLDRSCLGGWSRWWHSLYKRSKVNLKFIMPRPCVLYNKHVLINSRDNSSSYINCIILVAE